MSLSSSAVKPPVFRGYKKEHWPEIAWHCCYVSINMKKNFVIKSFKGLVIGIYNSYSTQAIARSSHHRCSMKKPFLKNFAIITGKQLRWNLSLIKFEAYNFIKKRLKHRRVFPLILQNFYEQLFWRTSANVSFCFPHQYFPFISLLSYIL